MHWPLLGRFGDIVDFRVLPETVRTLAMAGEFGAHGQVSQTGLFEACGSPGEGAQAEEQARELEGADDNSVGTRWLGEVPCALYLLLLPRISVRGVIRAGE